MRRKQLLLVVLMCSIVYSQLTAQLLTVNSKDSLNGKPKQQSRLIGRLKLNGLYDVAGSLYGNSAFLIHENDVSGKDIPGFWVDMRQSQLRFTSTTQLRNGKEIRAMLEGDFEGGVNRTSQFRLRHAWVAYDHWMLGQNWSTFGDASLWPASLLDWDGPTGMVLSRRIQIRYTGKFSHKSKAGFELAMEHMEPRRLYDYTTNTSYGVDYAPKRVPDFVGALRYDCDNGGFLKVAGLYRNIGYDSKDVVASAPDFHYSHVTSWGVTGMTSIFIHKETGLINNVQAQWNIGKGIADYFLAVGGSGLDGFANQDMHGTLNLLPVHSGFLSYQRFWTSKFHSMVVGSYNHFYDGAKTVSGWDKMTNYHFTLNMAYDFLSYLMVAIEPQIGYKELAYADGSKEGANAIRINFGMLFNF
ncbi:MAG: DcaP family trimeric outer membrane transporter [Chitinophagaceae bacterium]